MGCCLRCRHVLFSAKLKTTLRQCVLEDYPLKLLRLAAIERCSSCGGWAINARVSGRCRCLTLMTMSRLSGVRGGQSRLSLQRRRLYGVSSVMRSFEAGVLKALHLVFHIRQGAGLTTGRSDQPGQRSEDL